MLFCGNNFIIATFLWSFMTNEGDFLGVSGISQPTRRAFTGPSSMSRRLVPWAWRWLSLPPGYSVEGLTAVCRGAFSPPCSGLHVDLSGTRYLQIGPLPPLLCGFQGACRVGGASWGRNSSWTGGDSALETPVNPRARTCRHLLVFFWLVTL